MSKRVQSLPAGHHKLKLETSTNDLASRLPFRNAEMGQVTTQIQSLNQNENRRHALVFDRIYFQVKIHFMTDSVQDITIRECFS
jgi:hypothetical protein